MICTISCLPKLSYLLFHQFFSTYCGMKGVRQFCSLLANTTGYFCIPTPGIVTQSADWISLADCTFMNKCETLPLFFHYKSIPECYMLAPWFDLVTLWWYLLVLHRIEVLSFKMRWKIIHDQIMLHLINSWPFSLFLCFR